MRLAFKMQKLVLNCGLILMCCALIQAGHSKKLRGHGTGHFKWQPQNQHYKQCTGGKVWTSPGKCCESTCEAPICIALAPSCEPACQCPSGMILNTQTDCCVKSDQCPEPKCTGGKVWTDPGKCCEPTCSEPVCKAQADCEPACQCPDGMLLDDRPGEDQCFTPDECPEPKCTGGKVWTNPGKCCEPTCSEPVCIAQADCEPACQCPDGMLLDDRPGEDQCFTPDECPDPVPCTPEAIDKCGFDCLNKDPDSTPVQGTECTTCECINVCEVEGACSEGKTCEPVEVQCVRAPCFKVCSPVGKNICELPSKTGPCEALISRWFFNSQSNECEEFIYGGCFGNTNNFASKLECQMNCDICTLPAEPGRCKGSFPRWFFNDKTQSCEKFTYGGCGGNGNNFDTDADCKKRCGSYSGSYQY